MSIRAYIDLLSEAVHVHDRRPLKAIRIEDVIGFMVHGDSDCLGHVSNHWDAHIADKVGYDFPQPVRPEHIRILCEDFLPEFKDALEALAPITQLPEVEVTRFVPDLSKLHTGLGVHWSFEDGLYSAGGGVRVHGVVDQAAVNWLSTVAHAMFQWDEEKEITCLPGSPVRITKVEFDQLVGKV